MSETSPRARRRLGALAGLGLAAAAIAVSVGLPTGASSATAAPTSATASMTTASTTIPEPSSPQDVSTPEPSTPPSGDPTGPTDAPAPPASPVLEAPSAGFVSPGAVSVRGTGEPAASIAVSVSGGSPLCTTTVDGSGEWSCEVEGLRSSSSTTLIVTQDPGDPGDGEVQTTAVTIAVLTPPTVTGGPRGLLTNGALRGTAFPGAVVTASAGGSTCQGVADGSGAWSCPVTGLADGSYEARAWQETEWSGGPTPAGAAITIDLDATPPASPVLSAPGAGVSLPTAGAPFSGAGEDGAVVSVFADAYVVCQAPVADGAWSCTASEVPAGTYRVVTLQQDAAGNVSVQSAPLSLVFGSATASPSPAAPTTPAPTAAPAPAPAPDGSTPQSPDATPGPSSPEATPVPPGDGGTRGHQGGTWADATQFTSVLSPILSTDGGAWWLALVVGAGVLALVALPARLLEGALSTGRGERSGGDGASRLAARLTGRNRSRYEYDRSPQLSWSPVVVGAGALLASAAVSVLSVPVLGQPAYLRLFLAAAVGLAIVNAAAVVPAVVLGRRRLGRRRLDQPVAVRLAPVLLLVSAATALLSRVVGLEPALVFGLVAAVAVPVTVGPIDRGRLALEQLVPLLILGSAAWCAGALLPPPGGALGAWFAEVLTIVALSSFGTASVLALPLGSSPGRALLAWSPAAWSGVAVVSFAGLAALLLPALGGAGRLWIIVVACVGFAALSVSVWAWQRWVAPALEEDSPS